MTGEKSRFSVEGDLQIHKIMQLVEKKKDFIIETGSFHQTALQGV